MRVSFLQAIEVFRMRTNHAPLVADLFLFCYESDFMISLSGDNQAILLRHLIQCLDIWMVTFHVVPLIECTGCSKSSKTPFKRILSV